MGSTTISTATAGGSIMLIAFAVIVAKGAMPPVTGFWSLSIYNEHHFFIKNPINRFSVGTKNKDLNSTPMVR